MYFLQTVKTKISSGSLLFQRDELQSSDPKAYRDVIDDLKGSKKDSESSIDQVIWERFLKSLNSIPSLF